MDSIHVIRTSPPKSSPSTLGSPIQIPSQRSSVSAASSNRLSFTSTPSLAVQSSRAEMSITEQIARNARKSTVLNDKNALLILAIPDYDDYRIMQPYSCRSLSNKSQFIGGKDFITRHNPQEVSEFKKQYSREVGNLGRQHSVLSPPKAIIRGASTLPLQSAHSFSFLDSTTDGQDEDIHQGTQEIWRKTMTAGNKPCWILTQYGIDTLIGPEYRITTRLAMTHTPTSPRNGDKQHNPFSIRETSRIGAGIDLSDDKTLATLVRSAANSPVNYPRSPTRSPYREPLPLALSSPSKLSSLNENTGSPARSTGEMEVIDTNKSVNYFRKNTTSTHEEYFSSSPFAMEVSPPCISVGSIDAGEVYLFPIRIRNVGSKQERYRIQKVNASVGGQNALIAQVNYDKETARLAPGLTAMATLTLSFGRRGIISGYVRVEAEEGRSCVVNIEGTVR